MENDSTRTHVAGIMEYLARLFKEKPEWIGIIFDLFQKLLSETGEETMRSLKCLLRTGVFDGLFKGYEGSVLKEIHFSSVTIDMDFDILFNPEKTHHFKVSGPNNDVFLQVHNGLMNSMKAYRMRHVGRLDVSVLQIVSSLSTAFEDNKDHCLCIERIMDIIGMMNTHNLSSVCVLFMTSEGNHYLTIIERCGIDYLPSPVHRYRISPVSIYDKKLAGQIILLPSRAV